MAGLQNCPHPHMIMAVGSLRCGLVLKSASQLVLSGFGYHQLPRTNGMVRPTREHASALKAIWIDDQTLDQCASAIPNDTSDHQTAVDLHIYMFIRIVCICMYGDNDSGKLKEYQPN